MSATITCGVGDDPLSFLLDGDPPADPSSFVDVASSNLRVSSAPSGQKYASTSKSDGNDGNNDRATGSNVGRQDNPPPQMPPPETPQERAARLLAMCDERGVGTKGLDGRPPPASSALQGTSDAGGGSNTGGNPRRSLRSSQAFAQLVAELDQEAMQSSSSNDDNCSGPNAGLFDDSLTTAKEDATQLNDYDCTSDTNVNGVNTVAQTQQGQTTRSVDASFLSSQVHAGSNIDVDDLLRSNDRLEDECHRLRVLLSKRTKALEAENQKINTELSHIRDAHRTELTRVIDQSQSVVADLMTRCEHLQKGYEDNQCVIQGLMEENQQLRSENHFFRERVDDLEVEIEGGSTVRNSRIRNRDGWLSGWGRGRTVDQQPVSTPSVATTGGELQQERPSPQAYSGHYSETSKNSSSSTVGGNDALSSAKQKSMGLKRTTGVVGDDDEGESDSPTTTVPPPSASTRQDDVAAGGGEIDEHDEVKEGDAHDRHLRPHLGDLVGIVEQSTRSLRSLFSPDEKPS